MLGDDPPAASVPGEIVPGDDFYSYADKYEADDAELLVPAPLDRRRRWPRRGRSRCRAFEACRCEAMARVDLFLEERDRRRPARLPGERGQHDPGVHADLDVPAALGGDGRALPGAARPPDRPRDRAPRPPRRYAGRQR